MPIGLEKKADSLSPPRLFGIIELAKTEMSDRKGAHGWESTNVTVLESVALKSLIAKSRKPSGQWGCEAVR